MSSPAQPASPIEIRKADLALDRDREDVRRLIDRYAADPMGDGSPLPKETLDRTMDGLAAHPAGLQYVASVNGDPAGLAVCFLGFSTFAGRTLLNLHDLIVDPDYRRQGIARRLLEHLAAEARRIGCCKLTLEVRADNAPAQSLYRQQGFRSSDPLHEFWTKPL